MSEDQQKQPESVNSESQKPLTPAAAGQSRTELEKTSKTLKLTENREQPFLKAQGIRVLKGTIGLLEGIVERLETESVESTLPSAAPSATIPSSPSVLDTKLDTRTVTPELEPVSSASGATPEIATSDAPTVVPESAVVPKPAVERPVDRLGLQSKTQLSDEPSKPKLIDRVLPSFGRFQAFWNAILQRVRLLLPSAWSDKLSDWALTGAIASIVVVILWTTVALLPETPEQLAKAPPNSITAPPELKAPEEPELVEVAPPPEPELTPEQSLIASIQNQVAQVTEQYGNGLIQSIEANFLGSRLIVRVSDGWYGLKEAQQNKLADEILRQTAELDFSKLEITDPKGTLLARSPVVGPNMVILKRQDLAANT